MAGLEAPTAALFSAFSFKSYRHSSLSKLHYQAFSGLFTRQTSPFPLRLLSAASSPVTSQLTVQTLSAAHDVSIGNLEEVNPTEINQKRKLYVVNLPPFISGPFVTKMFRQCGVVQEVEIIKEKDGRSRGYAFVTMATSAQAQAVIERFNNKTVAGRTIRIQYAKQFKKPAPSRNLNIPPASETRFKLYVSNLGFKVRANHLRECFTAVSSPISARVVFDGPLGRSIGYGFVSYAKKEEAEAALTALNGQELMGRPLCIQFSEKMRRKDQVTVKKIQQGSSSQRTPLTQRLIYQIFSLTGIFCSLTLPIRPASFSVIPSTEIACSMDYDY